MIFWNIFVLLEYAFHNLLAVQGDQLSRETVFWIWNVKGFLFNEGLHFALPALLEVPNISLEMKIREKDTFYARKPGSLEPRRAEVKTAKAKTVEKAPEKPNSLLLSARGLLQSKVQSKLIKVAEYKGEALPNVSRHNIELKNERGELRDERGELKDERGEPEKLELSIPRSNEEQLRNRQPCTVYCRNHNSFARHYY